MAGDRTDRLSDFRFRRLEKPEEFRAAEQLQRAALGEASALAVPAPHLRLLRDHGGLVLGAFADIYLAGVAVSSIGWDGTTLYHLSHLTAVRPEYQNHHVGLRLKSFQRDEVLGLGLSEVRWTFDPLASRSAYLGLHRLGARADSYLPNYFGQLVGGPAADPETDRLRVRWTLGAAEVERRLTNPPSEAEPLLRRWGAAAGVVETEAGDSGLRVPRAVIEPDGPEAHLEVPFDLAAVHEHEPKASRRWRHAVRDAFRLAFDAGLEVDDFAVLSLDHERRAFYFLRPRPTTPPKDGDPRVSR